MKRFKKWILSIVSFTLILLILAAALVIWVDPFFQYHAPLEGFPYLVFRRATRSCAFFPAMDKYSPAARIRNIRI